jgi:hypothetical protein
MGKKLTDFPAAGVLSDHVFLSVEVVSELVNIVRLRKASSHARNDDIFGLLIRAETRNGPSAARRLCHLKVIRVCLRPSSVCLPAARRKPFYLPPLPPIVHSHLHPRHPNK